MFHIRIQAGVPQYNLYRPADIFTVWRQNINIITSFPAYFCPSIRTLSPITKTICGKTWAFSPECWLLFQDLLKWPSDLFSEIVHIQGGQCGNQIGSKFWWVLCLQYFSMDHGLRYRFNDIFLPTGRFWVTSTALTPLEHITVTLTCNWSALMSTIMRQLEVRTAIRSCAFFRHSQHVCAIYKFLILV
jgi:hypothetical protein